MSRNFNRLVAYIIAPLIFALIGLVAIGSWLTFNVNLNGFGDTLTAQSQTAVGTAKATPTDKELVATPSYGAYYANIYCERFQYSGKIYYGQSSRIMNKGVCQQENNSFPGFGGKVVLYGGNKTEFWFLEDIADGDIVRIDTGYGRFKYEVVDIVTDGGPENIDEFGKKFSDEELLVMCTDDFKETDRTVSAHIVRYKIVCAKKIKGADI